MRTALFSDSGGMHLPKESTPLKDNTPQGPHPTCEQNGSQTGVKT